MAPYKLPKNKNDLEWILLGFNGGVSAFAGCRWITFAKYFRPDYISVTNFITLN